MCHLAVVNDAFSQRVVLYLGSALCCIAGKTEIFDQKVLCIGQKRLILSSTNEKMNKIMRSIVLSQRQERNHLLEKAYATDTSVL